MFHLLNHHKSTLRHGLRFFFNTSLEPHSPRYLALQLNLLKEMNQKGEIQILPKNHWVVISNINAHHLVRDIPAYDLNTLHLLSPSELQLIKDRCEKEGAGLELAVLPQALPCIKLVGEYGASFYYLDRLQIESRYNTLQDFDSFMQKYRQQAEIPSLPTLK